jgi:hypothetical protein
MSILVQSCRSLFLDDSSSIWDINKKGIFRIVSVSDFATICGERNIVKRFGLAVKTLFLVGKSIKVMRRKIRKVGKKFVF